MACGFSDPPVITTVEPGPPNPAASKAASVAAAPPVPPYASGALTSSSSSSASSSRTIFDYIMFPWRRPELLGSCQTYSDNFHISIMKAADAYDLEWLQLLGSYSCDFNLCKPRNGSWDELHLTILNYIVRNHPRKRDFDVTKVTGLIKLLRSLGANPDVVDNYGIGATMQGTLTMAYLNSGDPKVTDNYRLLWRKLFPFEALPH